MLVYCTRKKKRKKDTTNIYF